MDARATSALVPGAGYNEAVAVIGCLSALGDEDPEVAQEALSCVCGLTLDKTTTLLPTLEGLATGGVLALPASRAHRFVRAVSQRRHAAAMSKPH
jgi:hypothetical protein